MKQKLTEWWGTRDKSTIIIWDFNTFLLVTDKPKKSHRKFEKHYQYTWLNWYLSFYLQKQEKEEHIKTKVNGREKVRKIKPEFKTIESGKTIEKKSTKPEVGSSESLIKLVNL